MSVVRIEALRALAALIELRLPELKDRVCVGVQSEHEEYPNLSIQPSRWLYEPEQALQSAVLPGNRVVYALGEHECACVLSIVATNPTKRAELEGSVIELFTGAKHPLTGIHMPGCLIMPVVACPQLGSWFATFDLESDEWNDGLAQDKRLESRIVITATIPALAVDSPVYTINQLILGVTEDLSTAFDPTTAIPPAVELVLINEDGTIEPWTP